MSECLSDIRKAVEWLTRRCGYGPPCGRCTYCGIAKSISQFDSEALNETVERREPQQQPVETTVPFQPLLKF